MVIYSLDGLADPPKNMKLTFRIQKSCQNRQSITLLSMININTSAQSMWPIESTCKPNALVNQSDDQPMGVFVNHHGLVKYLTANKIADVHQTIARECHPDLTKDELMRFTSHSGRVWAVILLDEEAGMNPDFIKSQLHWRGDSYRLFL
jgi:hypothetical protein